MICRHSKKENCDERTSGNGQSCDCRSSVLHRDGRGRLRRHRKAGIWRLRRPNSDRNRSRALTKEARKRLLHVSVRFR